MMERPQHEVLASDGELVFRSAIASSASLMATGDLDFHDRVSTFAGQYSFDSVFDGVRSLLSGADVVVSNLETVLVDRPYTPEGDRAFLIADARFAGAMRRAGVDVASMANNHTMDLGADGLTECLAVLKSEGVLVIGAGENIKAARSSQCRVLKTGLKLRFFAYSFGCGQIASLQDPGCAEARLEDIVDDIRTQSQRDEIIVVSLHVDAEFEATPSPSRMHLCRTIAEAGAQIVLCHHPHVPQGIERWGDALIAYSLGNFVTPISTYMLQYSDQCHLSFVLKVDIDHLGVSKARIIPIAIDENGLPVVADDSQGLEIVSLVAQRSEHLRHPALLQKRYDDMARRWLRHRLQIFRWGITELSPRKIGNSFGDLLTTPSKRIWALDAIRSYLKF